MGAVLRVLAVLVIVGIFTFGYFWIKIRPRGYPYTMELIDKRGRMATFKVVGKLGDQLYVERAATASDGSRQAVNYNFPIDTLRTRDQVIVRSMPQNEPPEPERVFGDAYIVNRERRIREIVLAIQVLGAEADGGREGIGLKRNRQREINELRAEKQELESDIEVFKLNKIRSERREG